MAPHNGITPVIKQAEELVAQGDLEGALAALQNSVRDDPSDSRKRVFLFQLLCVLGTWDRALTQLNVAAEMNPENLLMAQTYRELLQCEGYRQAVFSGTKSPLVFGEPPLWIGELIQALGLSASGDGEQARRAVDSAFEKSDARSGTIDGTRFEWLADADMRLGPVLEAMVNGKYYWVPIDNIKSISFSEPEDLRDFVWLPAEFTWVTEGVSPGFVPARYPAAASGGSNTTDSALALSRKTEWVDLGAEFFTGAGQRLFTTDADDYPLFETREITFDAS